LWRTDQTADEAIIDTVIDTHQSADAAADGGMAEVDQTGVIPPELFKKYVAYARRNFDPVLSDDAQSTLKDWYLNVRGLSKEGQISINTRMFEGAIRLSQASARARLSDTVEEVDTERAISLIMHMLNELGYDDEGGGFDIDMINQGKASPTQRDRIKNVKSIIERFAAENETGAPISKVIAAADDEMGMDAEKTEKEIEKLRRKGEIYEPEQDHLRTS
jgi:replicative DNA helicase Mcm